MSDPPGLTLEQRGAVEEGLSALGEGLRRIGPAAEERAWRAWELALEETGLKRVRAVATARAGLTALGLMPPGRCVSEEEILDRALRERDALIALARPWVAERIEL